MTSAKCWKSVDEVGLLDEVGLHTKRTELRRLNLPAWRPPLPVRSVYYPASCIDFAWGHFPPEPAKQSISAEPKQDVNRFLVVSPTMAFSSLAPREFFSLQLFFPADGRWRGKIFPAFSIMWLWRLESFSPAFSGRRRRQAEELSLKRALELVFLV